MEVNKISVHRTHCCVRHGCKYGDENCPVVTKQIKQDYLCEDCDYEGIKSVDDLEYCATTEEALAWCEEHYCTIEFGITSPNKKIVRVATSAWNDVKADTLVEAVKEMQIKYSMSPDEYRKRLENKGIKV